MKAYVTLTYKVTVLVEGNDIDQITEWANEHTPSEAADDCRKNGHCPHEDYDEYIDPVFVLENAEIKIN